MTRREPEHPPRLFAWILARALPRDARDDLLADLGALYAHRRHRSGAPYAVWWIIRQTVAVPIRLRLARRVKRPRAAAGELKGHRRRRIDPLPGIRDAIRAARSSPQTTLVAIITIGAAIAINVLLLSLFNGVGSSAPAMIDEDLVKSVVVTRTTDGTVFRPGLPYGALAQLERADFEALAQYEVLPGASVEVRGEHVAAIGFAVGSDFLRVAGVQPGSGRFLSRGRTGTGELEVFLAHHFWRRHFRYNQQIVGRELLIDGVSHVVVGIGPEGFDFPGADFWAALDPAASTRADPTDCCARVVVRLRDATDLQRVRTRLATIGPVSGATPDESHTGVADLASPSSALRWGHERRWGQHPELLLTAAVLAAACLNLVTIFLARGAFRAREYATRLALGASRTQVAGPVVAEVLLLAAAGSLVGLALAQLGVSAIRVMMTRLPFFMQPRIDERVLLATFSVAVVSGLAVAVMPSLAISRLRLAGVLRMGGADATPAGPVMSVIGYSLAGQIAATLSLTLLAGSALGAWLQEVHKELGYEPEGVLTATLDLNGRIRTNGYPSTIDELEDSLSSIAEHARVRAAGVSFIRKAEVGSSVTLAGESGAAVSTPIPDLHVGYVTPEFFRALEVPVKLGATMVPGESPQTAAVVNEALARRLPGYPNVLGRRIALDGFNFPPLRIIGVVGNIRDEPLFQPEAPPALYFFAADHLRLRSVRVSVRVDGPPAALVPLVRSRLGDFLRQPNPPDVELLNEVVSRQRRTTTVLSTIAGSLALLAFLFGQVGVSGLVSLSVAGRVREFAIRSALGATRRHLLVLVFRQHGWLFVLALPVGLAGYWVLSNVLFSQFVARETALGAGAVAAGTGALVTLAVLGAAAGWRLIGVQPHRVTE